MVVANALGCDIFVSEFKLQSCYDVHFRSYALGEGMNPRTTQAMVSIVPLLFVDKNCFNIK